VSGRAFCSCYNQSVGKPTAAQRQHHWCAADVLLPRRVPGAQVRFGEGLACRGERLVEHHARHPAAHALFTLVTRERLSHHVAHDLPGAERATNGIDEDVVSQIAVRVRLLRNEETEIVEHQFFHGIPCIWPLRA